MSLAGYKLKTEYRSLIDNVTQDFYIPLLRDAISYKRAVGFFSSSGLVQISKGIAAMAQNGGKIQLVASPYLSEEDVSAIQQGYGDRDKIIEAALLAGLDDCVADYSTMERLNLLSTLIADGILDIKIAYTEGKSGMGMYHEKMGIIEDAVGNKVAFSGSMNESATAMAVNYEAIDVFCNWEDPADADRVLVKENAFHSIWNDGEPNIRVLEFPSISQALIDKYKKKPVNWSIDDEEFPQGATSDVSMYDSSPLPVAVGARIPKGIILHEYQVEAIETWIEKDYCGIFDMATGTGKTYTGLGAIAELSQAVADKLAVIIVCPYQHLVEQWVEDIVRFNIKPIIGYSSSTQKDWKKRLSKAITDQKIRNEKSFFCFICTNATFTSDYVQAQLDKIKSPILLVVDEAHNFGAKSLSRLLDSRFQYRLALSATLDRHRDEDGTAALYNFFGDKCIEYSLERAIEEDKLTPYKYYPIVVYLTDDELSEYEQLTMEISKCLIKGKNGTMKLSQYGEMLALKRARIVAGAAEKLTALRTVIAPYRHENNLLVYCGATNVVDEQTDNTRVDTSDIRQIEAVTRILGNEFDMDVAQFTSRENIEQRATIKEQFQRGDRLQAIVAIKCLDEGVNIPGIKTAFILASTTNPKEYIQRRGRVLRKAQNKEFAEIYDFITLPRPLDEVSGLTLEQAQRDKALAKNELLRLEEFGRLAMNPMDSQELIWDIQEAYHLAEKPARESELTYE